MGGMDDTVERPETPATVAGIEPLEPRSRRVAPSRRRLRRRTGSGDPALDDRIRALVDSLEVGDPDLLEDILETALRLARTANRGDAIIALNALMEAMDRYNFTTGTLREIRGGPPPIVVVEDANKQIVQHRVAPVSAIYRNDQPVLLQQLRPGDQLKMLRPSDAGLIMYVEATGR